MAVAREKHVILSYNWDSKNLVSKIYDILVTDGIKVWMDINGGMGDNINSRYVSQHDCYLLNA
jgi:hypothetical protein